MSLLEVKNLKVHYPVKHRLFSRVRSYVKVVDSQEAWRLTSDHEHCGRNQSRD